MSSRVLEPLKKRSARGPVYHRSLLAVQRITTIIQMVAIESVLCILKIVPAKGWQIKRKIKSSLLLKSRLKVLRCFLKTGKEWALTTMWDENSSLAKILVSLFASV